MYINTNTTYVKKDTEVPIHFRLPANVLGLDKWDVFLQNKDLVKIIKLDNVNVQEYGTFTSKTQVDGIHVAGSVTIKVSDSGLLRKGDKIRINNEIYEILNIESSNHVLTLDKVLPEQVADRVHVKVVENVDFLGCYWATITPTELGRYKVVLIDKSGTVLPIEEDIEVLTNLEAVKGNPSKLSVIDNKAVLG